MQARGVESFPPQVYGARQAWAFHSDEQLEKDKEVLAREGDGPITWVDGADEESGRPAMHLRYRRRFQYTPPEDEEDAARDLATDIARIAQEAREEDSSRF